jgi:(R,R)-butanediol dehydrogenase / meso-butanediol dehydrogenase / diacetyl reductase
VKGLLFPGDRQVRLADFPEPEPGAGEVVVAMRAAAVCGSDLHGYRAPAAVRERAGQYAIIPGHEPSRVVHALGEGVSTVAVGDRVAVYHYRGCGVCENCRGGRLMWCRQRRGYGGPIHGSDADLLVTDARNCLPLPDDASFEHGALLMCVAGTAYEAMRKLQVSGRATVAIVGLGPVGLTGLLMARAMGAPVIGIDVSRGRLELAQRLGAAAVIDASQEDAVAGVRRWSGGEGVTSVFETSGSMAGQTAAVAVPATADGWRSSAWARPSRRSARRSSSRSSSRCWGRSCSLSTSTTRSCASWGDTPSRWQRPSPTEQD